MSAPMNYINMPCAYGHPAKMCEGFKMNAMAMQTTTAEGTQVVTVTMTTYANKDAAINKAISESKDGQLWVTMANAPGLVTD